MIISPARGPDFLALVCLSCPSQLITPTSNVIDVTRYDESFVVHVRDTIGYVTYAQLKTNRSIEDSVFVDIHKIRKTYM